jgi:hypothetical protein
VSIRVIAFPTRAANTPLELKGESASIDGEGHIRLDGFADVLLSFTGGRWLDADGACWDHVEIHGHRPLQIESGGQTFTVPYLALSDQGSTTPMLVGSTEIYEIEPIIRRYIGVYFRHDGERYGERLGKRITVRELQLRDASRVSGTLSRPSGFATGASG